MKFNRKFLFVFVGVISLSFFSTSASFADSNDKPISTDITKIKLTAFQKTYAYLNNDTANNATKKLILKARCEIVYGKVAWTVNGAISIKNADGTVTKLPEFKDLYPGWDLKQLTPKDNSITKTINYSKTNREAPNFNGNVNIPSVYSSNQFYKFVNSGNTAYIWALTLPFDSINLGIKNVKTNIDIGWVPNVSLGKVVSVLCNEDNTYAIRCNSYDEAGWARLKVKSQYSNEDVINLND